MRRSRGPRAAPGERHFAAFAAHFRRRERRGVFQPRRQAPDLPVDARRPHLRPAVRHEHRRSEREARLDRRRQDDLRLLLRRRPQDLLRLDARGRHGLPARSPIRRRATSGASTPTTSTPRTPTARRSSGSRTTASTRPKVRCRPTAERSYSRRSRTAISTSTR